MLSSIAKGKMRATIKERHVAWPPIIISQTPMGFHRDVTSNKYARDVGRSTQLSSGDILFQFGDTFCKNNAGLFLGLTDNTCSISTDSTNPTLSSYKHRHPLGEDIIKPFIELEDGERQQKKRIWSFSGIVEKFPDWEFERKDGFNTKRIVGWTYYEVREMIQYNAIPKYLYTGIAEVVLDVETKQFETIRQPGYESDHVLFGADEPRFGVCAVTHGENVVYLFGHKNHGASTSKDICVARVHVDRANERHSYEFWNGRKWVSDIKACAIIIRDVQHGQIFYTKMFGESQPYKWAFVGCNGQGDSKMQMGRAKSPEGPWDIRETTANLYTLTEPRPNGFRYCVYPHPWADETEVSGDLTISWSEGGMNGAVLMSKIRFQMQDVMI